jgi:hypothetical protein
MFIVLCICVYISDKRPNVAFFSGTASVVIVAFIGVMFTTNLFHLNPETEKYTIQSVSITNKGTNFKVVDKHGHKSTKLYKSSNNGNKIVQIEDGKQPYLIKITYHIGSIYQSMLEYHVPKIDLASAN